MEDSSTTAATAAAPAPNDKGAALPPRTGDDAQKQTPEMLPAAALAARTAEAPGVPLPARRAAPLLPAAVPAVVFPPSHALRLRIELRRRPRVDTFLRRAAVRAVLLHVLYSRGILPCAAGEVLHAHQSQREDASSAEGASGAARAGVKRRRPTRAERKFAKAGKELSAMLEEMDRAFGLGDEGGRSERRCGVRCAVITVGPSFSSPREQYLIRFHGDESEGGCTDEATATSPAPPEALERMENEMSRRCIREFLRGTMDPDHSDSFVAGGGGGGSTSKVNLALLVEGWACERLFRVSSRGVDGGSVATKARPAAAAPAGIENMPPSKHPDKENMVAPPIKSVPDVGTPQHAPSPALSRRLVIRRNFVLRTPRMLSKKKNIHRPFVILDVVPNLSLAAQERVGPTGLVDSSVEDFELQEGDVWMSLRSTTKGFKL